VTVLHSRVPIITMAIAVALAAYMLLVRDRSTLRPGMSQAERNRVSRQNHARTVHWSHVIFLIAAIVALVLNFQRTGRQPPWATLAEIAVLAILVFKYYRDRSEERIGSQR
jgi:Na+/H+ antiporter NhaD/arsenite permease-like protein